MSKQRKIEKVLEIAILICWMVTIIELACFVPQLTGSNHYDAVKTFGNQITVQAIITSILHVLKIGISFFTK